MQALILVGRKRLGQIAATQNVLLRNQAPLLKVSRRFEGAYPWFPSMAENVPKKNPKIADETVDETEVITRIMSVLHRFFVYDLETFDWKKSFTEQGVDSL